MLKNMRSSNMSHTGSLLDASRKHDFTMTPRKVRLVAFKRILNGGIRGTKVWTRGATKVACSNNSQITYFYTHGTQIDCPFMYDRHSGV